MNKIYVPSIMVAFAATFSTLAEGLYPTQYMTYTHLCDRNSDCNERDGEVCWRLYNGCHRGVCMCNPATHVRTADGACRPYRLGDEPCSANSQCVESMTCRNGTCQCVSGDMTHGSDFCIFPRQKLLGQSCNPSINMCLQVTPDSRYTEEDVECSYHKTCQCTEGYKQDGYSCVQSSIGDVGCTKQYHCKGGAICLDRKCICPSGYRSVAKQTRCAKNNALFDLPLGAACDEINESMYCAHGLVCHQCDEYTPYRCVQYLNFHPKSYMSRAAMVHHTSLSFLPIVLIVLYFSCLDRFIDAVVTR